MPVKKTTQNSKSNDIGSFDLQKLMQSSDSYKSLIYGIVTVVVLFVVIALGIRTLQQNKAQIDDEALMTQNNQAKTTASDDKNSYTVVEGDTLWGIAEKSYNDGFKWNEIAKANNIQDTTSLEKGMKLTIPKIPSSSNEVAQTTPTVPTEMSQHAEMQDQAMTSGMSKIDGQNYTVVHGDNLWDIAVRAYGDGYRWVDVAKANNLSNPGLIFSGNILTLPRP
jgi:nucleoid-associated protein YgaU